MLRLREPEGSVAHDPPGLERWLAPVVQMRFHTVVNVIVRVPKGDRDQIRIKILP